MSTGHGSREDTEEGTEGEAKCGCNGDQAAKHVERQAQHAVDERTEHGTAEHGQGHPLEPTCCQGIAPIANQAQHVLLVGSARVAAQFALLRGGANCVDGQQLVELLAFAQQCKQRAHTASKHAVPTCCAATRIA